MTSSWQIILYYPLGFLPSLFFGLRFLIQWIKSEKAGVSFVSPVFWKLSLAGNVLAFSHYALQGQYLFALIQVGNALIAWRNLNLMEKKKSLSFAGAIGVFAVVLVATTLFFLFLGYMSGKMNWMRVPEIALAKAVSDPGFLWHFLGFTGQALFSSRFWIQWWGSERDKKSELGSVFWWLSLLGSLFSVIYFVKIQDVVSIINQSCGIVPYIRNLMLITRVREDQTRPSVPGQ